MFCQGVQQLMQLITEIESDEFVRDKYGNFYPKNQEDLYWEIFSSLDPKRHQVIGNVFTSLKGVVLEPYYCRTLYSIIGPDSQIGGNVTNSIIDGARIIGKMTEVYKGAIVSSGAEVSGGAVVKDYAEISGEGTIVSGKGTMVDGAGTMVFGGANILKGSQIFGGAVVSDTAVITRETEGNRVSISIVTGAGTLVSGPGTVISSGIVRRGAQVNGERIHGSTITGEAFESLLR